MITYLLKMKYTMRNLDLNKVLGFKPNEDQNRLINSISSFANFNFESDVFIMSGAAGTGKTSVTKAIIEILLAKNINIRVCAPTNRAAKVISSKTNFLARSIHSEIYTPEQLDNGSVRFNRKRNDSGVYTIYIIDESSMISDVLGVGGAYLQDRSLLTELIDYIKQGNPKNKILFIGDKYQLPPINEDFSPALNKDYLSNKFNLKCQLDELNVVMRQGHDSPILSLANRVRENIDLKFSGRMSIPIHRERYDSGGVSKYMDYYNEKNIESVVAICAANSIVDDLNTKIRRRLSFESSKLCVGDVIVVQKNRTDKEGGYLHKGDFGKILSLDHTVQNYAGLTFVNAELLFYNTDGSERLVCAKIILESIDTTYGRLGGDQEKVLIASAMKDNKTYRESKKSYDDEYVNALRLRHGYAITCHQAQGGEWDHVFIHPWNNEYRGAGLGVNLPWTYTAITRARSSIFSYN